MFSTELKFTIDILFKWFNGVFKLRFNKLDAIRRQKILKEKPIDWFNEKCIVCDLKLAVSLQEDCEITNKITTAYDFTVQK